MDYLYFPLLIIEFILFPLSFYLIWKRNNYREISIRSPLLLAFNNLGGFLMSLTYIIYELNKPEDKYSLFCVLLPNNYLVFHCLMILSFYLRCHRIIECCDINIKKRAYFLKKQYLFTERFYLKILMVCMLLIITISFLFSYLVPDNHIKFIPFHFQECIDPGVLIKFKNFILYFWIILNFVENIILVTYTYKIFISPISKSIKIELIFFLILWILSSNLLRVIEVYIDDKNYLDEVSSLIFIFFLLLCLFTNTYVPIIYSFYQTNNFNLHFTTGLLDNFFLFLSNEHCLNNYVQYLKGKDEIKCIKLLNFYLEVMTLRLKLNFNLEYDNFIKELKILYDKYFEKLVFTNSENDLFPEYIRNVTKTCYFNTDNNDYDLDIFDEALSYSFNILENKFIEYKNSKEFRKLFHIFSLDSDIFCRMYNTGLITKN